MYEITYDRAARILRLKLAGFWTMEEFGRFVADLKVEVDRVSRIHPKFGTLSDSRSFQVQSPEVAAAFEQLMAVATKMNGGRAAIVVSSVLNKIQAERVFRDPIRVFLNEEEARAWLIADVPRQTI